MRLKCTKWQGTVVPPLAAGWPAHSRVPRTMEPTHARGKGAAMASSPEYLEYVLDLLSEVEDVSTRKMMGEYLLYAGGKLFGGVYDDRFLVKETKASAAMLSAREVPYEGAAPMLVVDIEDREAVAELVAAMLPELPAGKRRKPTR